MPCRLVEPGARLVLVLRCQRAHANPLEQPVRQLGGSAIPAGYLLKHLDGVPNRLICAQLAWSDERLVTLGQQPIEAQDGMLAVFRDLWRRGVRGVHFSTMMNAPHWSFSA